MGTNNEFVETVNLATYRYDELLDKETRLDVIIDLMISDLKSSNYIGKDDLKKYLYCAGYRGTVESIELEEKKRKEQQENE